MTRKLLLAAICLSFSHLVQAQLPDGSIAPDWTMTDLNGTSHNLYSYLNNNKVVFLDFSATWCGPCWSYHNSHAFRDVYNQHGPSGDNHVRAFMIESDASTNTNCLYGPSGCVGGTQGNWVSGTTYPIIDNSSQFNPYQINYYPTIYGVCPDKKIYEVGQIGPSDLWQFAQGCSAPTVMLNNVNHVGCYGNSNGSIDVGITGGISPFTYHWSNGATTQDLNNLPAGAYTLTVTGSLGGTKTIGPITVQQPSAPLVISSVSILPEGCVQGGIIEIEVSGGTLGYNFLWSNGASGPINSDLSAGTYAVSVTDANGCSVSQNNLVVEQPAYPVAAAAAPSMVTCSNPFVTLNGNGSSSGPLFSYLWSTSNGLIHSGENTLNNCVVTAAGTYTLLVINNTNNCIASASTIVSSNLAEPVVAAGLPGVLTCTNGQATLTGVGPTGQGYNVLWTTIGGNIASGATTLNPVVTAAGSYILTITNTSNGCSGSSTTTVTSNIAAPNVSAAGGAITCINSNVNLTGNSTTPGVSYAWSGPNGFTSTQQNPTVSAQGSYQLTVTNPANNCTATATAQVAQSTTPPQASAQGGTITCSNSSVTLSGSSTTPNVSYAWSGPNNFTANQQDTSVSAVGSYLLTVTGSNGCTATTSGIVSQNITPPTANAGPNGILNCSADEVVLNGTSSSSGSQFTYVWTTTNGNIAVGANTLTPTVDEAGSYQLTVSNSNNGCTSTASTTVIQRQPVTASIASQTNVLCNGTATGTATAAGSGGNGSFTFAWSTGATTESVSGLGAGTYSVVVKDGENCEATKTVIVTEPALLTVNATTTAQSAPNVDDGSATANPLGGTGTYIYEWSNGASSQTISGLSPGNYTVTVTDENGCFKTQAVTVNIFGCAVSTNMVAADATCHGAGDGSASIELVNAAAPQVFVWSNGAQTPSIGGLAPGTYTVSATDGNGCEVVASVEVQEPSILFAHATATGVTLANGSNGTATVNPTGGTGPFSFSWSNGQSMQTITGLSSANYTVTVTDANGCTAVQTVPVAPFSCSVLANATANDISCHGNADGQATVTLNGGLTPYTYHWSNGEETATISGLEAGNYSVSVSDAVNCPAIIEVAIADPAPLELVLNSNIAADCGVANGQVSVSATGGTAPQAYQFAWSNGETEAAVNDLVSGAYSVTVSDENGCSESLQVQVGINDPVPPIAQAKNLTLALNANGEAVLDASQVDDGSSDNCTIASMSVDKNSFDCSELGPHQVTLTVVDEAGNSSFSTSTVEIVDNLPPIILVQNITVSLDENGMASITPELLDAGSTDNCGIVQQGIDLEAFSCANIGQNAVVLTVKDASGNLSSGTAIVTVQDDIAPTITCPADLVLPNCEPVANFNIEASDNCATVLATLQTTGFPSGSTFPTGVTIQTFVANDGHGNVSTCSFSIAVAAPLQIDIEEQPVSCFGEADGSATVEVSGGTAGYSFLWSTGETSQGVENLGPGQYNATVTDAAGCSSTQSIGITEPSQVSITIGQITPETLGSQNGAIELTVSGGTAPLSFEWSNASGVVIANTEDISGVAAGTYSLKVTDANGCVFSKNFTVQFVSAIENQGLEQRINLFPNPSNGIVTLELHNGTAQEADILSYDMTGKLCRKYENANLADGHFNLDLSDAVEGLYLVRITIEGQVFTKRLVIQR